MNLNYQILPPFDMVVQIISFIIHKIEDGMRIIMNMNIFEKLKEVSNISIKLQILIITLYNF